MIVQVRRNFYRSKRNGKRVSRIILPERSRTRFPVKVINEAAALMRLGYTPSNFPRPMNDYDVPNFIDTEVA
jgi:hypothetical protein